MPDFIYQLRPRRLEMLTSGPTDAEQEATRQHFAYLSRGVEDGIVLLAGRTATADEQTFGICIFRAVDDAAAQAFVDGDPAVKANVMEAALFPYRLALLAPTWERDEAPRPARVPPPDSRKDPQ